MSRSKRIPGNSTFPTGEKYDDAMKEEGLDVKTFDEIFGGEIRPGETARDAVTGTKEKLEELEKAVEGQGKAGKEV